jgi:hypothetical protein
MNLSKLVLIAALAGAAGISTMAHADRVHVILGVGGPLGPSYAPAYYGGGFGYPWKRGRIAAAQLHLAIQDRECKSVVTGIFWSPINARIMRCRKSDCKYFLEPNKSLVSGTRRSGERRFSGAQKCGV